MNRRRTSLLLPFVLIGCTGAAILIRMATARLAVETARSRRLR